MGLLIYWTNCFGINYTITKYSLGRKDSREGERLWWEHFLSPKPVRLGITSKHGYSRAILNCNWVKGTLQWSDKSWYIIILDTRITLVWFKILNSSIFTLKSGLETQFLVLLCVLNASIFILLCVSNASIFFGLPKNLSAILIILEQLLVVREITIQSKF